MGANFEITIIGKQAISILSAMNIFRVLDKNADIVSIHEFPDWAFSEDTSSPINLDCVWKSVCQGKKVQIKIFSSAKNAGAIAYREGSFNILSFWISTEDLPELDHFSLTPENSQIINQLTEIAYQSLTTNDLLLAMGSEMFIEISDNINEIIEKSYNVMKWIIL